MDVFLFQIIKGKLYQKDSENEIENESEIENEIENESESLR